MRRLPTTVVLSALLALAPACGDDGGPGDGGPGDAAPTTAAPTTTAAAPGACAPSGSSPATFDVEAGTHAAYLTGIDTAGRKLSFDVVRWLTGEEAADAYREDEPGDPDGPPNDYYITNDNPAIRTATVAGEVTVRLLSAAGGAELEPGSWEGLEDALGAQDNGFEGKLSAYPFWLTMRAGEIAAICQQYVP